MKKLIFKRMAEGRVIKRYKNIHKYYMELKLKNLIITCYNQQNDCKNENCVIHNGNYINDNDIKYEIKNQIWPQKDLNILNKYVIVEVNKIISEYLAYDINFKIKKAMRYNVISHGIEYYDFYILIINDREIMFF